MSLAEAATLAKNDKNKAAKKMSTPKSKTKPVWRELVHGAHTLKLAKDLEALTRLESRVTILGYQQRGGTPSAEDRILATRLGSACATLVQEEASGVMLAARGDKAVPVALEDVVGKIKTVPLNHSWIECARRVGTSFGD
jgi:6-phosphofructokinase 1